MDKVEQNILEQITITQKGWKVDNKRKMKY